MNSNIPLLPVLVLMLLLTDLAPTVRAYQLNTDDTGSSTTAATIRNRRIYPVVTSSTTPPPTTTKTTTPPPPPTTSTWTSINGRNGGESTFGAKTLPNDAPETSHTRTIQRMVGGHLHHPAYRKYEEISVTRKNTRLSKVFFHKKTDFSNSSSEESSDTTRTQTTTTTVRPTTGRYRSSPPTSTDRVFVVTPLSQAAAATADYATSDSDPRDHDDDDAQLLSDDNRLDSWSGDRLLLASAGAGPEKPTASSPKSSSSAKDDSKKTLSDQVAEGKYGLIQTELFATAPRRPGILSYAANAEVPSDTAATLGGLHDDDIWLAEDHLLVLKGGGLSAHHAREPWRPIDDYEAPQRQVRLPDNPRVPPPFLVQLDDNGPVQFVGNHQLPLINPFTNQSLLLFPGGGGGFPEAGAHDRDQANVFARPRPHGGAATPPATADLGYQYLPPLPPWLSDDNVQQQNGSNRTAAEPGRPAYMLPPIMRLPFPPQGSLDDSNSTDPFDEDDPALYYPPPYSFTYESNYTNPVPPGPLVPGIVLPPPPNFFTRASAPQTPPQQSAGSVRTSTARAVTRVYKPISRTTTTTSAPQVMTTTTTSKPTTSTTTASSPTSPHPAPSSTTVTSPVKPSLTRTIARPVYVTTAAAPPASAPLPPRTVTQLRKVVVPAVQVSRPSSASHSEVLSFVSKDQPPKANPVYYEYFDARESPPAAKPKPASQRIKSQPAASSTTPTTTTPAGSSSTTTISQSTTTTTSPPPQRLHTIKLKPQRVQQQYAAAPITQLHPQKTIAARPPSSPAKRPYNAYLPIQPFDYDRYVYITPKPEIIPNGISNDVLGSFDDDGHEQRLIPLRKAPSRPLETFNQEVNSIRQTLQFYRHSSTTPEPQRNNNEDGDNEDGGFYSAPHISTAPPPRANGNNKAKAVYEYSFESSTLAPLGPSALLGGATGKPITGRANPSAISFLPPAKYDATPFKPMVQYSAPLDEAGGFQAMTAAGAATPTPPSSSAAIPISETAAPPSVQPPQAPLGVYTLTNRGHAARNYKDPALGPPYRQQLPFGATYRRPVPQYEYPTTTTPNWVSIEKQIFRQIHQQQQPQALPLHYSALPPKEINVQIQPGSAIDPYDQQQPPFYHHQQQHQQRPSNYYHYPSLQQQQLPNNPYTAPQPYFRQTTDRRQQLQLQQHQQQQQQFQPQSPFEYGDLSNDTAVNYINPRPPINPDAEFINPYQLNSNPQRIYRPPAQQQQQQQNQHQQQQQQQQQPHPFPPPPLPNRVPGYNRYYPSAGNTQPLHSLAQDLLVNYKLPLPHQDFNAEILPEERFRRFYNSQPQTQQQQQQQQQQPQSGNNNAGVVRYKLPGEPEANVYFYTPSTRRQQQQQQQQPAASTPRNNN